MRIILFFTFYFYTIATLLGLNENDPRNTPTVRAVASALPSVVNIGTERIVAVTNSPWGSNDPFDQLFKNFFEGQRGQKEISLGSGAIISSKGLIVTNSHVVHRATRIIVTTSDGKQYLAKEIAGDTINDIALLQLVNLPPNTTFKPIKCAIPDSLLLGEPVIAVGNPYGLGNSISRGVLSAIGRKISLNGKVIFKDILQTDAAINPGNSGGPLININGEMMGINTAVFSKADGIGFAIPLKRIEIMLASWMIPERFRDVSLGIVPAEKVIDGKVVFVVKEVLADSPAETAGVESGDIIEKINDIKIDKLMEISNHLWDLRSGDVIEIELKNKGIVRLKVKKLFFKNGQEVAYARLGLGLQALTPKLAVALNYPFHGGFIVNDLPLYTQVKRGDVLVRIGEVPIYDFKDIIKAIKPYKYGDVVSAEFISLINRNGRNYILKKNVLLKIK